MERRFPFDIVFVGGGPANLTAAIHLTNLIKQHNATVPEKQRIDYENKIAVLEKGPYFGAHITSGAVLDPVALHKLMPNHLEMGFPLEGKIEKEAIFYFTKSLSFKLPFIPPFLENRGNYVVSLSKVVSWMAKQAEKNDVVLLKEVAAVDLLHNQGAVLGVKTDDRVYDPAHPTQYRYPGYHVDAKVTVLGEGSAGVLTKQAISTFKLDEGRSAAIYELGVKEIYEFKEEVFPAGQVWHVMGYPLTNGKSGGAFLYGMSGNRLAIGLCAHLGSKNPHLDVHQDLQKLKSHPKIKAILDKGQVVSYGAKTLPCGGFYSIPKLTAEGLMIVGDGANLVDSMKLKGIHTAMESGLLVAETLFEAYKKGSFAYDVISTYEERFEKSFIHKDLWKGRNFTPAVEMGVPFPGGPFLAFQLLFNGANLTGRFKVVPDYKKTKKLSSYPGKEEVLPVDEKIVVNKMSDVYLSRAMHEEHSPSHISLKEIHKCHECFETFGAPCRLFCPAQVYEWNESLAIQDRKIMINFSNCLHCKTCDLKCPQDNIKWVLPEAGGGPQYTIQ